MTVLNLLMPVRLPSKATATLGRGGPSWTEVEGPALATNEDDGLLIVPDDIGAYSIVLENY